MLVAAVSLKPDLFEGLKFDFSKPLNMNFAVTHRQGDNLNQVVAAGPVHST